MESYSRCFIFNAKDGSDATVVLGEIVARTAPTGSSIPVSLGKAA